MKDYSEQDLRDFAKMLGIDLDEPKRVKKPNPNQKAIDTLGNMLRRYGGKK